MANRAALYNHQLEQTIAYEAEGKALIISPTDIYGLGTLSKDNTNHFLRCIQTKKSMV
jgi:hypothetical protein